ncbi:MAG: DUF3817 domain-containing protein [Bacteroidia bacterium]
MTRYFTSALGWLRLLGFIEGITLLILVFVAVPMKYIWENGIVSKTVGPVHGAVFIVYVVLIFRVGVDHNWKLFGVTGKMILACFIPFGTFYLDAKVLRGIHENEK